MKLAQCIILDLLKDYDPVPLLPETCNFHFSGVQLLDQDNPTDDPSILYIGTTTQISSFNTEKLKDFCIICIGKKEDVSSYIKNYQANLILIPENHSLASIVNTLYTGFHRILNWDGELQNAILRKQNYQSLFSIGGRFFGKNAMIMVNSSYNVIGTNLLESPTHEKLDFILKNGYYSKELTDGLAQMGYMAKGFQYKTPTILNPPNYMNCPIMVLSMHADNGIFLGFITIYFIDSQPTATQFELFAHFDGLDLESGFENALLGRERVLFVFHDDGTVIQPFAVFFDDAFFSLFGESDGKTVARNRDDAALDFGQF